MKTETGERVFNMKNEFHLSRINNIIWSSYYLEKNIKYLNPIISNPLLEKLILTINPHIFSEL